MPDSKSPQTPRAATTWLRWGQWLLLSAAFAAIGCFLLSRVRVELQKPGLTPVLFAALLGGGIGYAATVHRIGSRVAVLILAALLGAGAAAGMTALRYDAWRDALRDKYLGDLTPPMPTGATDQPPPPPGALAELMRQLRRDRQAEYQRVSGFDDYLSHRLAGFQRLPWPRVRPRAFFVAEVAAAGFAAAIAAWLIHGQPRGVTSRGSG